MTGSTLVRLCRECAHGVFEKRAPTPAYADAVSRLLMGTAATESLLRYRRQGRFDFGSDRGAWGIWQTEQGSVSDGVKMLVSRPELRASVGRFIFGEQGDQDLQGLIQMGTPGMLRLIHASDRVAVAFARLHYFRVLAPVPEFLEDQAAYYKKHYNTVAGKGSPEKYIADWRRLVEPAL